MSKWLNFFATSPREKMSHFDLKKIESLAELKIWPKFLGQNDSIFSLRAPREKMSRLDLKKLKHRRNLKFGLKSWVTDRKKSWPKLLGQNDSIFLSVHREKRLSHFDLKSWVTGGTIIRLTSKIKLSKLL